MTTEELLQDVDRLTQLEHKVWQAYSAVQTDLMGGPVLRAVVGELRNRVRSSLGKLQHESARDLRDAVIAMQQAAESAQVAVLADVSVSNRARHAVLDAYRCISLWRDDYL